MSARRPLRGGGAQTSATARPPVHRNVAVEIIPMVDVVDKPHLQVRFRAGLALARRLSASGHPIEPPPVFDLETCPGNDLRGYIDPAVDNTTVTAYRAAPDNALHAALKPKLELRRDVYRGNLPLTARGPRGAEEHERDGVYWLEWRAHQEHVELARNPTPRDLRHASRAETTDESAAERAEAADKGYPFEYPFDKGLGSLNDIEREAMAAPIRAPTVEEIVAFDGKPSSSCACEMNWLLGRTGLLRRIRDAQRRGDQQAVARLTRLLMRMVGRMPVRYPRGPAAFVIPRAAIDAMAASTSDTTRFHAGGEGVKINNFYKFQKHLGQSLRAIQRLSAYNMTDAERVEVFYGSGGETVEVISYKISVGGANGGGGGGGGGGPPAPPPPPPPAPPASLAPPAPPPPAPLFGPGAYALAAAAGALVGGLAAYFFGGGPVAQIVAAPAAQIVAGPVAPYGAPLYYIAHPANSVAPAVASPIVYAAGAVQSLLPRANLVVDGAALALTDLCRRARRAAAIASRRAARDAIIASRRGLGSGVAGVGDVAARGYANLPVVAAARPRARVIRGPTRRILRRSALDVAGNFVGVGQGARFIGTAAAGAALGVGALHLAASRWPAVAPAPAPAVASPSVEGSVPAPVPATVSESTAPDVDVEMPDALPEEREALAVGKRVALDGVVGEVVSSPSRSNRYWWKVQIEGEAEPRSARAHQLTVLAPGEAPPAALSITSLSRATYHWPLPVVTNLNEATDEFQTIFKDGILEASEDPRHPDFLDANFRLFDDVLHRPRELQIHYIRHKDPWNKMCNAITGAPVASLIHEAMERSRDERSPALRNVDDLQLQCGINTSLLIYLPDFLLRLLILRLLKGEPTDEDPRIINLDAHGTTPSGTLVTLREYFERFLDELPVKIRVTRRAAFELGYQALINGAAINKPEVLCYKYSTPEGVAALKQCRQYADNQAKILYDQAVDGFIEDFRELLEDEQFQPAAGDADAAHWHQKYVDHFKNPDHLNAREVRRVAAEAVLAATVKATADGDDESDSED